MRILVCGHRRYSNMSRIRRLLEKHKATTVAHGGAPGADQCAERAALRLGLPVMEFPADWKSHGRAAGPIRNSLMLKIFKPDLVLAFPLRGSRGTWDMVNRAHLAGVPVEVIK